MRGRDPLERHRSATPLELLFDLTLVVAFAQAGDQLAHAVAEGHIATALWGFAFVVLSFCWGWINFTWFSSAFDTDDWPQRLLTMMQMVGIIVVALGIPAVFESLDAGEPIDYSVVAAGYVVMRASLIAMWLRAAIQDPANRRVAFRYAGYNAVIQTAWVVVAIASIDVMPLLATLIVLLWAAELGGHVFATRGATTVDGVWSGTPWNAHHIAERYGLLVLITLGEVILGTIAAVSAIVSHGEWTSEAVLIVVAGVGLSFGLWWTYFVVPAAPVLARHRNRSWGWGYGHILMFAALAAVGAGLHVAAYAVEGETQIGTVGVVLSVAVPVLIFCFTYFVLYAVLFRSVDSLHVLLAAAMVAVLSLGWCLIVVMASPFVVAVGYETSGYRHIEIDLRREG